MKKYVVVALFIVCSVFVVSPAEALNNATFDQLSGCYVPRAGLATNSTTLSNIVSELTWNACLLIPRTKAGAASGDWAITGNVTVPNNIVVKVPFGPRFDVDLGITLTACIEAGPYQIKTGSGTLTFPSTGCQGFAWGNWWGLTGDNSTDNATAFNSMAADITSGLPIKLALGTYVWNSTIEIPAKTVDIDGQGSTLRVGAIMSDGFSTASGGKLKLRNMTIDGNGDTYAMTGNMVDTDAGAGLPELYNVLIDDVTTVGIWGDDAATGTFVCQDSTIQNSGRGMRIRSDATGYAILRNCSALNNTGANGSNVETDDGIEVHGGQFVGNPQGLSLRFSKHIRVNDLKSEDNGSYQLAIGLGATDVSITGSTFYDSAATTNCISVDTINGGTNNAYVTISGNTIRGCDRAIRINGANFYNINGNTIVGPGTQGITIKDSNSGVIDGNYCSGSTCQFGTTGTVTTAHVGYGNIIPDLGAGTPPFTGAGFNRARTSMTRDSNATLDSLWADVFVSDTSASSRSVTLPATSGLLTGESITIVKSSAANTLSVNANAADSLFNADGSTTQLDQYYSIWGGATYTVTSGGWTRRQQKQTPQYNVLAQTTDATTLTVLNIPLDDESAYQVCVWITAKKDDSSDRATYAGCALYYRDGGGGATQEGATQNLFTPIESDASWDYTMDTTTNNARIRVTGAALTTIDWTIRAVVQKIS